LGPIEVLGFVRRRFIERLHLSRRHWYRMHPSGAAHPVWGRSGTSDLDVYAQIFLHREYRVLDDLADVDVVIDCGANVGYSSAYFLTRFPNCTVIAVEPDSDNFATLQTNLHPYGSRVRAVHSAVWSDSVGLVMNESGFRDGREWARQVRPARSGEQPMMQAVEIQSLIDMCGADRISILKMDIEGAELEVFSSPTWRKWIDRVDTIAIEIHTEEAYHVTMAAFEEAGFETAWSDELVVAQRR
jgi:FkbM family methyltransferase